jgi:hypothetical protein
MKTLVPCVGCGRHVRATESACPFCHAEVTAEMAARAAPSPGARLGRAALFAFGATIAVTATACGGGSPGNDAAAPQDVQSQPDGQMMALYGAPPPDAGPADDGSPMARYGAVPAPDAG